MSDAAVYGVLVVSGAIAALVLSAWFTQFWQWYARR